MSRAKFIIDLLNQNEKTVVEESKLLDQRKFDLFQNNNLYESAPPSASIVSPKRDLPSINPPYSAPLLAKTYHDIVSVENLIREENVSCKTHQNYTEIRKSRESPHSEISGIEELSSSPVRVFSDSSVSWFPDSEEDRCFKKKRRVYVAKSSSESDSEESTFIASRSKIADSRGLECFQHINIKHDFQSRNKQYSVPQQSTLPSSNSDSSECPTKSTLITRKRRKLEEQTDGQGTEELMQVLKNYKMPPAYSSPLPISEAKKKDLNNLCAKGIIPQELHLWYQSLPTSKDVVDRILEPDVTEEGEEEVVD
ncbi:unnamed protein product [Parnassius apollo]|uniref:(apollo) hypothetical protein n=1 Tax=Parnassius apollo TaxID=110799 RepID=A0A8S3W421_PARAO|nr:unnamed protein product [Parnassius apollo]